MQFTYQRLIHCIVSTSCLVLTMQSSAEIMEPVDPDSQANNQFEREYKLGGTIGKIDAEGVKINSIYYPFNADGVKIHGFNGKLQRPSALQAGMLVSFAFVQDRQSIKISEIWIIKNE